MTAEFWSMPRIAGALLLLGMVVTGTGLVVLLAQGTASGLVSAFRGVEGIGQAASAHRTLEPFARSGMVLLLLGFGVLALRLSDAGERTLALLAFSLLLVSTVLAVIEGSFHARVTAWAGEQWAQTGTVPELFEPLRQWVNQTIQLAYLTFGFAAMALYGWALLSTGVLPSWVGWVTLGWNVVFLALLSLNLFGVPAVLFAPVVLIGIMLLVSPTSR